MGSVEPMPAEKVPLARLFLSAAGVMIEELHTQLDARGWQDVRHAWGFISGRLNDGPATVNDLAAFLGVSKQAASKTIEQMQRHGLVNVSNHPDDGRARLVEMTIEGQRFRHEVEEIYAGIESSWADIIGMAEVEMIREHLSHGLRTMHGGEIPPPAPLK